MMEAQDTPWAEARSSVSSPDLPVSRRLRLLAARKSPGPVAWVPVEALVKSELCRQG